MGVPGGTQMGRTPTPARRSSSPPVTRHAYRNRGSVPTRVLCEARPPSSLQAFLEDVAGLSRAGKLLRIGAAGPQRAARVRCSHRRLRRDGRARLSRAAATDPADPVRAARAAREAPRHARRDVRAADGLGRRAGAVRPRSPRPPARSGRRPRRRRARPRRTERRALCEPRRPGTTTSRRHRGPPARLRRMPRRGVAAARRPARPPRGAARAAGRGAALADELLACAPLLNRGLERHRTGSVERRPGGPAR